MRFAAAEKSSVVKPLGAGLAKSVTRDESEYWVATLPPTLEHRRLALVVVVMLAVYGVVVAFQGAPVPRFDSFIPAVMAIDGITSPL
jgi:hypothetical protein